MLKSEMVAKNPLRAFDQQRDGGLEPGQTGLIAARAGTGKTALLIQIALDNLFRNSPVLHVSIGETVGHVQAWYEEIFRDLAVGYDLEKARQVWDEAVAKRLILTFRTDVFTVETLKERLSDLVAQDIFKPRTVLVDGLDLHRDSRGTLEALRTFSREYGIKCWVACRTHAEDGPLADLVSPMNDLFDVILGIEPTSDAIKLTAYKNPGHDGEAQTAVSLDPKTLLLVTKD